MTTNGRHLSHPVASGRRVKAQTAVRKSGSCQVERASAELSRISQPHTLLQAAELRECASCAPCSMPASALLEFTRGYRLRMVLQASHGLLRDGWAQCRHVNQLAPVVAAV